MQQVQHPSDYLSPGNDTEGSHRAERLGRLQPDMSSYAGQGQLDQAIQGRVRRMDSTSGTSASSHHSSNQSNHNGIPAVRARDYSSINGNGNSSVQPSNGHPYRTNQYQVSPRSSRSDLRERDREYGSYSPASHPSTPSLPYPPGSGPPTPMRPYSSQHHPFQNPEQVVRTSIEGHYPRPPYPHFAQPPTSPHSAGPNLSPGLSGIMNELKMPQRSATDPQQWDDRRGRYEDGGRARSRTLHPSQAEDTYGAQGGYAAPLNRSGAGLGFGSLGEGNQTRDQSPSRLAGVAGPGPNTERQYHNLNNLRIAPPSPSRKGRRSPNRSPTTLSSGNLSAYMNVPLPAGSDQSHQSHEHRNLANGQAEYQTRSAQSSRDSGNPSPTSVSGQINASRSYDMHSHGNFASTAPGPPVPLQKGSGMPSSERSTTGTVTPSTSGSLTASNTTNTSGSMPASSTSGGLSPGQVDLEGKQPTNSTNVAARVAGASGASTLPSGSVCGSCTKPVKRQFVRAMGKVYHLDCFRCKDCNIVVAAKFFPVDDPDGSYPLCERDYFARLDLICGQCDKALRGSYITACNKKFHVEHFTCSACATVFGPQDSYYEHDDQVYCHFHYSTRFATKCVGCANAILKQFVEINRNQKDECWHPECYMIHKFWNVKLTSKFRATPANSTDPSTVSVLGDGDGVPEEHKETAETLRAKQVRMESQVEQIWRVLSAFEESSAACISEMLRFVSAGQYAEAILMAERFILHVEILFAAIDDLEAQFVHEGAKGMPHSREAKMLCRKTVNFFSLLSHTQESPEQKAQVTQELLALVTGLAHYLKILIRIALTGSLKLEREHGNLKALDYLLARLSLLAKDDGDPSVSRRGYGKRKLDAIIDVPPAFTASTNGIAYGYRSLALEIVGESVLKGRPLTPRGLDECQKCRKTVEEDCIRLGLFERWHAPCLQCAECDQAASILEDAQLPPDAESRAPKRRALPRPDGFTYVASNFVSPNAIEVAHIFCRAHGQRNSVSGFEAVSRLEQFAFLLNVALRRLWDHLRHAGVITAASTNIALPVAAETGGSLYDTYRDSTDIKRLKSVNLDRKLSATARMPQRSTIVESPSGKTAKGDGSLEAPRSIDGQLSNLRANSPAHSKSENGPLSATPSGGSHEIVIIQPAEDENDAGTPSRLDILRPAFGRANTHVAIISDNSNNTTPDASTPMLLQRQDDDSSPFEHEQGVTLADIPALVEAEQAKLEHRPPPISEGRPLIAELSALDATIVKHFALIALTKSPIAHYIDMEELFELVEIRKNQWWNKLFKPGKDKKDVKRKGVFGVPLEILVEKTGSDSQLGATNAQLRVPEFMDNVVSAMKQMDMSIEGIFRKNGNIKRLNSVAEALDRDASSVSLSDDNPVQLAALLKKFLRDLPDPLMTFRLHKLFCAAQHLPDDEERLRCLHLLMAMLPRVNRDTLEVLFVFLKWVASFSHVDEETGSKMDVQNLATVICPSILYSKGTNAMRDDSFVAIQAIKTLIEHQDEFYTVPKELQFVLEENVSQLFKDSLDLPPKEIYKHCSNYANARRPYYANKKADTGIARLGEYGLSSHKSDGNLIATAAGFSNGRANIPIQTTGPFNVASLTGPSSGSPTRPQSWADAPLPPFHNLASSGSHPGLTHQHSAPNGPPSAGSVSVPSGSPNSRRMWYPGHRGSTPSSPVMAAAYVDADRRPSSSLDRAMSPSHLGDR